VTAGLQKRFGTGRVMDTLLDETTILGVAQGAALAGFLPVPEIQYLAYVHNAVDQLRGEAASLQFFSAGQFRNPMVVRMAGSPTRRGSAGTSTTTTPSGGCGTSRGSCWRRPPGGRRGADAPGVRGARRGVRAGGGLPRAHRALPREGPARGGGRRVALRLSAAGGGAPPGEVGMHRRPEYGEGEVLLVSYANGLRMSLQAQRILERGPRRPARSGAGRPVAEPPPLRGHRAAAEGSGRWSSWTSAGAPGAGSPRRSSPTWRSGGPARLRSVRQWTPTYPWARREPGAGPDAPDRGGGALKPSPSHRGSSPPMGMSDPWWSGPGGERVYLAKSVGEDGAPRLWESVWDEEASAYGDPMPLHFSEVMHLDRTPALAPGGDYLAFSSARPVAEGDGVLESFNIWVAEWVVPEAAEGPRRATGVTRGAFAPSSRRPGTVHPVLRPTGTSTSRRSGMLPQPARTSSWPTSGRATGWRRNRWRCP
jgi:hypothetical protein